MHDLRSTYWEHYTECRVDHFSEEDELLRLLITIEVESNSIEPYVDTGGAYLCLFDIELVEALGIYQPDRGENTKLNIRGITIPGFLDRIDVGFLDFQTGEKHIFNMNVFYPKEHIEIDDSFPHAIIGFKGALEYLGFGYLPASITNSPDRFYFSGI